MRSSACDGLVWLREQRFPVAFGKQEEGREIDIVIL